MSAPSDNHRFRSLLRAKQAYDLGARHKVIEKLTGLSARDQARFIVDSGAAKRHPGGCPTSPEWFVSSGALRIIHASFLCASVDRFRALGFGLTDSLIDGYRKYLDHLGHDPRISFDRAFDLVGHVHAVWGHRRSSLEVVTCRECVSRYIALRECVKRCCPFCPVLRRDARGLALQAALTRPLLRDIDSLLLPSGVQAVQSP